MAGMEVLEISGFDISVRVSQQGSRSDDRFYSPETQEEACSHFIEEKGYSVGEVVEEINVSGGKAARTRGIERLVKRVEDKQSRGIVVYDFSRLSREEPYAAMALVGRIHDADGVVYGVADGFDSSSEMGAVHAAILAQQTHNYLKTARARSMAGAAKAKEAGRYCGQTPKGYDREDGCLVVNEQAAETVNGIMNGCLAGWSWRGMQEYAATRGMKLTFGGIKHVLHNRVYIGESPGGASPAIVDRETFERVQKVKPKRPAPGKGASQTLAQGLAVCASCGKKLIVTSNGRGAASYYCKGRSIDGCESRGCVLTKLLDEYVESVFLAAFEDGGPLARAYSDDDALNETEALLKEAVAECDSLLSNSSLLAQLGERAAKVLADADGKVELAQSAYDEAKRQAETLSGIASLIGMWKRGELSLAEKQRLLARALARVAVGNGRVKVAQKVRVVFAGEVVSDAPDDARALLALVQDRDELALNLG